MHKGQIFLSGMLIGSYFTCLAIDLGDPINKPGLDLIGALFGGIACLLCLIICNSIFKKDAFEVGDEK